MAYGGPAATLRTQHGTLLHVAVSPYPLLLAQAAAAGRWEAATRLCRCIGDDGLWAALAARALAARETATAEAAYAALGQVSNESGLVCRRWPTRNLAWVPCLVARYLKMWLVSCGILYGIVCWAAVVSGCV